MYLSLVLYAASKLFKNNKDCANHKTVVTLSNYVHNIMTI